MEITLNRTEHLLNSTHVEEIYDVNVFITIGFTNIPVVYRCLISFFLVCISFYLIWSCIPNNLAFRVRQRMACKDNEEKAPLLDHRQQDIIKVWCKSFWTKLLNHCLVFELETIPLINQITWFFKQYWQRGNLTKCHIFYSHESWLQVWRWSIVCLHEIICPYSVCFIMLLK